MNRASTELWVKRIFLICYDICAVLVAAFVSLWLRHDFSFKDIPPEYIDRVWQGLPFLVITTLLVFSFFKLYSSLWAYASAMEVVNIVSACVIISICNFLEIFWMNDYNTFALPRSFYVSFGIILGLLVFQM